MSALVFTYGRISFFFEGWIIIRCDDQWWALTVLTILLVQFHSCYRWLRPKNQYLSVLPLLCLSCRWTQPVLFPRWWWGMWGVWTKNQHQGLWCLHAPRVPRSVGIQCFSFPSRPAMPRLGHHWPAGSIPGKTQAMHGISCRYSESLLSPSEFPASKVVSLDVAMWPNL